jgi:hypothetical protein
VCYMSRRTFAAVLLLLAWPLGLPWASAADGTSKPELLVVYWASKNCKWCAYWESDRSGMERSLKESQEFRKIAYRVVKNERLSDPYTREDFPPDIAWIHERIERGEEKRGQRPSWVVYLNRKRLAAFYGTRDWEDKHLPAIKALVAEHVPG